MWYHPVGKYMHYSDPRGRGKEKSLFKETMAENFDNLGKETKINTRKPREFQKRWVQRVARWDTLQL